MRKAAIMVCCIITLGVFSGCLGNENTQLTRKIVGEKHYDEWEGVKNVTIQETEVTVRGNTHRFSTARFEWDGTTHKVDRVKITEDSEGLHIAPPLQPFEGPLNWIKENTSKDSVVLSWWDYGNMIRLFANRETVIGENCGVPKCLETQADKGAGQTDFEPVEKVEDVARFFTSHEDEAYQIAQKYGVDYVMVTVEEYGKSGAIGSIADRPLGISKEDERWVHPKGLENTTLIQMLFYGGENLAHFKQAYSNGYVYIYEVM
jgi:STT3/PglB/AglB core domain